MSNILDPIIEQTINEYSWSLPYAKNVRDEYERFMSLRNEDEKLSPLMT